ncbi:MAG: acetyltransferase [Herbinix sp.]|nr:acetyltransferase [Herbinix sp.]
MNITIRLGTENDIDELEQLYNNLNDHLAATTNYPGWKKGIYPARKDAEAGISEGCLYVSVSSNKIIGSIILRHKPEPAYLPVKWMKDLSYDQVLVIYTLVVHPDYLGKGIGCELLNFASRLGEQSTNKSLRLDVYENNLPAICLYEKCGFQYIDTVDLGLAEYNLHWFKLYEKLL